MKEENKKTILIVDDSAVIRELLKGYLKDKFDIIAAEGPKECLKILADTTPRIDLGLIDIEMPVINGFQLIKMIKKHPDYKDVPFVIVTSKDAKEEINKAVLAGACDYIVKPVEQETLLQKIDQHLKKESNSERVKNDDVHKEEPDADSQKDDDISTT